MKKQNAILKPLRSDDALVFRITWIPGRRSVYVRVSGRAAVVTFVCVAGVLGSIWLAL